MARSLGLATEWIEMANGCCYIDSCLCLGLATEWIEISNLSGNKYNSAKVSVLRPSGLKCIRIGAVKGVFVVSVLRPSGLKWT